MGWIETIRSLLGLQSNGHRETSDVQVTVEKEPAASSERAVKEATEADVVERDDTVEGDDEEPGPDAAEESDSESAEEAVEAEATEEAEEAAEAEATEEAEEAVEAEATEEAEEAAEAEATEEAEGDDDAAIEEHPSETTESIELTDIKGIGSAYADRLQAAGVEDGADLAAADAADLAAETDISAKRLQRWIDRVTER